MFEDLFRRPRVRERIRQNPHSSVLVRFAQHLSARGHSRNTVQQYVFAAEHFCAWLGRKKISRRAAKRFLNLHLPACQCVKPASRTVKTVRASLNRLFVMIGDSGVAPTSKSPADRLLHRYADHLKHVQGLAPSTIYYRLRYARTLITRFRVRSHKDLKKWSSRQIQEYVAREGQRFCPASGQVMATSVRSFLRFLLLYGLVPRDLSAAVPSFATWRLAGLPTTVNADDLRRLIAAADNPSSPVEIRDCAIVLCLVELGLRASDVADITVDGVDLNSRALWLKRRKQRESTGVPISRNLASAIDAYLRRGRPSCSTASLFVLHRAPRGEAMKAVSVRGVVRRMAAKAGLAERISGTHVIRHSVASCWIQSGATLKQIADLLGHRSIDTTSIYAKVDLEALSRVALPWPTAREVTR